MGRDSLFGERIVWTGKPAAIEVPRLYKVVAIVCAAIAVVSVAFAAVVALSLHAYVGKMLLFAVWCASLALASWRLPLVWLSGVEYVITDKHVLWRRGRVRRSIDRSAISYAIIHWAKNGTGDLTLVRAVPTGALRRTLSLTLAGVRAPDRLLAIVRGVEPAATLGDGDRPLAQRLDRGERVLWSAMPLASSWSARRVATSAVAVLLAASAVRMIAGAVPGVLRILRLHLMSTALVAVLAGAVAVAALLAIASSLGVAWAAWVRPGQLVRRTRYFVTNRRVLIRRGDEELHLDRTRIAYVISAPSRGLHDIFLVLDGPQARSLAVSDAFTADERRWNDALVPVFSAINDPDEAYKILHAVRASDPSIHLRDAA